MALLCVMGNCEELFLGVKAVLNKAILGFMLRCAATLPGPKKS